MKTWMDQQPHDILGNIDATNIMKQWIASVRTRTSREMVISILDYLKTILTERSLKPVSSPVETPNDQCQNYRPSIHLHFLEFDPIGVYEYFLGFSCCCEDVYMSNILKLFVKFRRNRQTTHLDRTRAL